jgi:hypothetical protein
MITRHDALATAPIIGVGFQSVRKHTNGEWRNASISVRAHQPAVTVGPAALTADDCSLRRRSMMHKAIVAAGFLAAAFGTSMSGAEAALTPVPTFGGADGGAGLGSERCLIGDANGNCTGGGAFNGKASIKTILEAELGTLNRVDDSSDQIWFAPSATGQVLGRARYAGFGNQFGWFAGSSGPVNNSTFNPIPLSVPGPSTLLVDSTNPFDGTADEVGGDLVQQAAEPRWRQFTPGGNFRWGIDVNNLATTFFTSLQIDNPIDLDQMVTFFAVNPVQGGDQVCVAKCGTPDARFAAVRSRFVLAWEDTSAEAGVSDYNDLVLEVVNVAPVPVPAALPLMATGLIGIATIGRRLRKATA